jgi:hypothetical protein
MVQWLNEYGFKVAVNGWFALHGSNVVEWLD